MSARMARWLAWSMWVLTVLAMALTLFLASLNDPSCSLLNTAFLSHPRQEERHEILSGILRGRVGGREQDFREGERAVGPPGVPHAWRNPSEDEELRIVSELRPALHMEVLLKVGFEIARDLKTEKKGIPKHLLRMMVLANEAKNDFYFTGAPRPVRKTFSALLGVFAYAGKRLEYGGFE